MALVFPVEEDLIKPFSGCNEINMAERVRLRPRRREINFYKAVGK